jgi:hypothetical protein
MRGLSGAVLIAAGVVMATCALYWSGDASGGAGLRAHTGAVVALETAPTRKPSVSQPQVTANVIALPNVVSDSGPPTNTMPLQVAEAVPKAVLFPPMARPLNPAGLARELQRQLKRVGCYQGQITGVWTTVTRRSMRAFTDHVNALLPVDQPDYILLAMLHGYEGQACGGECPVGQGRAKNGRCLLGAVVAARSKRGAKDEMLVTGAVSIANQEHSNTSQPGTTAGIPLELLSQTAGRMSLAGPPLDPPHASGKRETVTSTDMPLHPAAAGRRKPVASQGGLRLRQHAAPGYRSAKHGRKESRVSGAPSWAPWAQPWGRNQ